MAKTVSEDASLVKSYNGASTSYASHTARDDLESTADPPDPNLDTQGDANNENYEELMRDIGGNEVAGDQADTAADSLGQTGLLNMGPLPDLDTNTARSKEEQEREMMQLLVSRFDERQMARYAAFRRANIRRAAVRRYASQLLNQPISNNVAVVLAGMSKVLIGDIIELARELQNKDESKERKERGIPEPDPSAEPDPLLPSYVRKAWQIYKKESGTIPGSKIKPGLGGRMF